MEAVKESAEPIYTAPALLVRNGAIVLQLQLCYPFTVRQRVRGCIMPRLAVLTLFPFCFTPKFVALQTLPQCGPDVTRLNRIRPLTVKLFRHFEKRNPTSLPN